MRNILILLGIILFSSSFSAAAAEYDRDHGCFTEFCLEIKGSDNFPYLELKDPTTGENHVFPVEREYLHDLKHAIHSKNGSLCTPPSQLIPVAPGYDGELAVGHTGCTVRQPNGNIHIFTMMFVFRFDASTGTWSLDWFDIDMRVIQSTQMN